MAERRSAQSAAFAGRGRRVPRLLHPYWRRHRSEYMVRIFTCLIFVGVFIGLCVSPRAIMHDEKMYPNPHTFNPDRFMKDGALNSEVLDPAEIVFGFGRR